MKTSTAPDESAPPFDLEAVSQRVWEALKAHIDAGQIDPAELANSLRQAAPTDEDELSEMQDAAWEQVNAILAEESVAQPKAVAVEVNAPASESFEMKADSHRMAALTDSPTRKSALIYRAVKQADGDNETPWQMECLFGNQRDACQLRVTGRTAAGSLQAAAGQEPITYSFNRHFFGEAFREEAKPLLDRLLVRFSFQPEEPEEPAPLEWDELLEAARNGDVPLFQYFDRALRSKPDAANELCKWLELVGTHSIETWLFDRSDSYPAAAFRMGFGHVLHRILRLVFRRRLLSIRSGGSCEDFRSLWIRSCIALSLPESLHAFWNDDLSDFQAPTPANETSLRLLINDENAFAKRLTKSAQDLEAMNLPELKWYIEELRDCVRQRKSPQPPVLPECGVAMVWDSPSTNPTLRSGTIVRFQLAKQSAGNDLFQNSNRKDYFYDDFLSSLNSIHDHLVAHANWYPLKTEGLPPFGKGKITGKSGGMAVHVAQLLAVPNAKGEGFALPPYVVISAASEADNNWKAGAVSGLPNKIDTLCEEGTRVFIVPASQADDAKEAARGRLLVLPQSGDAQELADILRKKGLVWQLNTRHLDPRYVESNAARLSAKSPFSLSRRLWIATAAASTVAAAAYFAVPQSSDIPPTAAMLEHLQRSDQFVRLWKSIRDVASQRSTVPYGELMQGLHQSFHQATVSEGVIIAEHNRVAKDFDTNDMYLAVRERVISRLSERFQINANRFAVGSKPKLSLATQGFTILYDGTVYDHVGPPDTGGWRPVQSFHGKSTADSVHASPVEAAYVTRKLRLRSYTRAGDRVRVAFELGTSGYGIVPVTFPDDQLSLFISHNNNSHEDTSLNYAVVLERPIFEPPGDREIEVVVQAIYLNAFQDQAARNKDFDRWNLRVYPSTMSADLAVVLSPDFRNLHTLRQELVEDLAQRILETSAGDGEISWEQRDGRRWLKWKVAVPSDWKEWQTRTGGSAIDFGMLGSWDIDH